MPLSDKDMASDILDLLKHRCVSLTKAAIECSNSELRNALFQMRQQSEQAQWELYRMMEQKGWYLPSGKAEASEVQRVRQFYQGIPAGVGAAYGADGGNVRL